MHCQGYITLGYLEYDMELFVTEAGARLKRGMKTGSYLLLDWEGWRGVERHHSP
jgi:hypothetical protein